MFVKNQTNKRGSENVNNVNYGYIWNAKLVNHLSKTENTIVRNVLKLNTPNSILKILNKNQYNRKRLLNKL